MIARIAFVIPVGSMFSNGLWIIILEMLVALGLAAFIVWWTLPKRKPPDGDAGRPEDAA